MFRRIFGLHIVFTFIICINYTFPLFGMIDEGSQERIDQPQKRPPSDTKENKEKRKKVDPVPNPSRTLKDAPVRATFAERFMQIVKTVPSCSFSPSGITASEEDTQGSRKWVRGFQNALEHDIHLWHTSSKRTVQAFHQVNNRYKFLPVETNVAVARLIFALHDGKMEMREIPFFFLSGWPANKNKDGAQNFAEKLSSEGLGPSLKEFSRYGIHFITRSYKGSEEKISRPRHYDPYKEEVGEVLKKETDMTEPIPTLPRVQAHQKLLQSPEGDILAKLYFHSEQAIWIAVKAEIERFKNEKVRRDIRAMLGATPDTVKCVWVDICSYYDMCWCCGDTFASCCHTGYLGTNVYVRATGCHAYFDGLDRSLPPYSLRDHRNEFAGYEDLIGFKEQTSPEDTSQYRPYVSHAIAEDFQ